MAMLASIHRDPKKHGPFKPADFHPLLEKSAAAPMTMAELRQAFGQPASGPAPKPATENE